jgi:LPXTG-motif cell wall-anchored protein
VIANNTVAGIYLSSSSNRNLVIGNRLEKNSIGVWVADVASKNNTFYHNNFINNTHQASVFGLTIWDDGTEGNYWSDYNGQDLNGDGIGDTEISHLGIDRFPLINEWKNTVPTADFTYSPADPKESQDIQFTDTSTDLNGTLVAWLWDFGDGNMSSQQNPVHKYVKKGAYNVTLTVTDNENATTTKMKTIIVALTVTDYTSYYVFAGIAAGALILIALLLLKRKKKKARAISAKRKVD